ncbi:hypothetical protein [Isoptericola croceus]|uniref:hypothetical protein n=1 Tax=Isoptericola croceus TaxID=3031406 RepID=UPI0023F811B3|nr:hypothetical protein [Isoptericola croceus]
MHHRRSVARTVLLLAILGTLTGAAACGTPAQQASAWDVVTVTDASAPDSSTSVIDRADGAVDGDPAGSAATPDTSEVVTTIVVGLGASTLLAVIVLLVARRRGPTSRT